GTQPCPNNLKSCERTRSLQTPGGAACPPLPLSRPGISRSSTDAPGAISPRGAVHKDAAIVRHRNDPDFLARTPPESLPWSPQFATTSKGRQVRYFAGNHTTKSLVRFTGRAPILLHLSTDLPFSSFQFPVLRFRNHRQGQQATSEPHFRSSPAPPGNSPSPGHKGQGCSTELAAL